MIGVNLIEVLHQQHRGLSETLTQQIRDFVRGAVTALRLENAATQPGAILGTDAPSMPKRQLLIQLPTPPPSGDAETHQSLTSFRSKLEQAFRGAVSQGTEISFSDSSDPTEITIVAVVYWMAARFAAPVQRLKQMYTTAMTSAGDRRNARYFCHLDDTYDRLPDLFPPETFEIRQKGRIFLDIGKRAGLIEASHTGELFLKTRDAEGIVAPERISGSEAEFLNSSDANIDQHVSAIRAQLKKVPRETLEQIEAARTPELQELGLRLGSTVNEGYRAAVNEWNERLKQLAQLKSE
jgi:hypothetical protein